VAGLGAGVLAVCLISATGALIAATLGIHGRADAFLTAYVAAFAEIVALSLFLSPFHDLKRADLIAGTVALFVVTYGIWFLAGSRPFVFLQRPPAPFPRRGPVLFLGVGVAVGLGYAVALILRTPPNGWDPLNYHLARVAFWLQSGRIGYIEPTYDERLNLNPPNAEIGSAFALGVTHDETTVGFVQFSAAAACAVGVFALARRVGLSRIEAAFGSLLFLTLPVVALQATGAKNDLVLASFLVAAAVFTLGTRRVDIPLAGLATTLAVGTKSTAIYGVILVAALALRSPFRRAPRIAAIVLGAAFGAYWYIVNLVETGHLLGDQSSQQAVTAPFRPPENLLTAVGTAVDTLDLSGAVGADIFVYAIAGFAIAAGLVIVRRHRGSAPVAAVVASVVAAVPLILLGLTEHVGRPALVHLYGALGKPEGYVPSGDTAVSSPTVASQTASWFGPLGLALVGSTGVTAAVLCRRGRLHRYALFLALAPAIWFVLIALTLSYNPWLGRFFIFPVAVSAAFWGRALARPAAAWSAAALGLVTLVLTLDHYDEKPLGLRLLDRTHVTSVWSMARWQVQSTHDPPLGPVFQFLDEQIPAKSSIALALSVNDFGYPAFGPHLERHVAVVPFGSTAKSIQTQWLYASQERTAEIDAACWELVFRSTEGDVFRRRPACA
jgi:hypothetical protein